MMTLPPTDAFTIRSPESDTVMKLFGDEDAMARWIWEDIRAAAREAARSHTMLFSIHIVGFG